MAGHHHRRLSASAGDPSTGGALLLHLYELRTEGRLRRAREWFFGEFAPRDAADVLRTWLDPGPDSASYRMVTTYWEMAAALVSVGAISAELFHAANTEHVAVFAKLRAYLGALRETTGYPDYLASLEAVVCAMPDASRRIGLAERYLARQGVRGPTQRARPPTQPGRAAAMRRARSR